MNFQRTPVALELISHVRRIARRDSGLLSAMNILVKRKGPTEVVRGTRLWALGFISGMVIPGILLFPGVTQAEPPELQTPSPVIYLADNLDEKDKLGYCIDTVGRGFAETLHAHSCKPRGGDVQFAYDASSRQIVSAAFPGKCVTISAPAAAEVSLGLTDCTVGSSNQSFDYDSDMLEFRVGGDPSLCLSVGESSRSAGPFMSRDLFLAPCASTDARFRKWHFRAGSS